MSLISYSKITDGSTVDASDVNTPLDTIYNDHNGGIDSTNLADNAVTTANITDASVTPPKWTNPYKFRCYRNAAANTGNNAFSAAVAFDTEQFDTGNNVSSGVFTAPVAGYYQFNWQITVTNNTSGYTMASLFIAGSEYSRGVQLFNGTTVFASVGSDLVYMTAGQTADIRVFSSSTSALSVGNIFYNYFSGFLVSAT